MDPVSTTVGLLFSSLIGGLTNYMSAKEGNRAAQAQAQQIMNNIAMIEKEVEAGRLRMKDALVRIDKLIKQTKGEVKDVMEKQVNQATEQITQQYRAGLETAMRDIRTELGQRRLFGSEAGAEARAKTAKGLTGQAGQQTTEMRERALNEIAKQMTQLNLTKQQMKQGERQAFQDFRLGALSEIMQMQNLATGLKSSLASPGMAFLSGATKGGLGNLVGSFFTPKETLKEMPTGSIIPGEIQENPEAIEGYLGMKLGKN